MASRNLAADIKAYNQKVSSGQKTEPTTKYNTPSQQGRTAQSYTRQNVADQKANREAASQQKKAQQDRDTAQQKAQQKQSGRNYLSEAQEGGKQQEQKGRNFLDEAVNGRAEAEKKAQDKARNFSAEANQETPAKITKEEREELVNKYQQAVAREQETAGYITDPFDIEGNAIRQEREQYENQLKAANQQLGLDTYTDLAEEARARDRIEGFQGERAGQYGAGLGIIADYVGEKTGMQGLEKWGEGARAGGRTAYNESQEDWANSLEGRPGIVGSAAGVAKSAANVAEDMAVNFLTAGIGGRVLMGLRAAGSGALTQEGREKNDTESVFAKAMLDASAALLSNKLLGALGGAYGQSTLGPKFSDLFKMIKNPNVRRAVANTEGFEEGLEFGISYIGDRLLGLDGDARNPIIIDNGIPKPNPDFWKDWGWGEFAQNVLMGYFLGTIFNGISAGEEYPAERIKAVADEAIEAAQSGLTFDEIADIAKETTKEEVVIKPGKHEAGATVEPEADADLEAESYNADDIVNEFNEQQGAEVPTPTEPNADTRARVQTMLANADAEQRGLAPGEIRQILEDPAALNAYAEETGTTARQARTDLENRLNGAPDETGSTAMNDRYQNADTAWDRFWNAANEGPEALARLIAEDPDNMTEYMKYYEQATGETMSNDPDELWQQLQELSNDSQQGGTTSENNANGMPRNEGNGQTWQNQGQNNATQNPFFNNGNQQQNGQAPNNGVPGYQDPATTGSGPEQVSHFFTDTLTKREGEDLRSPLLYLQKSDAETLQNAMNRLSLNREAEVATMMATTMWTDEQVVMAKTIGHELLNEARQTGDFSAYDAWRQIESEHRRAIARALRIGAEKGGVDQTEKTRSLANRYLDLLEASNADPRGNGPKVDPEVINKARRTVDEVSAEIGRLEADEAEYVRQGYSEDEAFDMVKDGYLDLAQRLVAERNMGLLMDNILGRNKAIREGHNDVQTRLRKMLAKEDPEYIRQYCRANNAGVATDVQYKARPTLKQAATMISSLQSMCMLFGTGTFLRNTESNVVFGGLNALSNNTAGLGADLLLSAVTGQRTRGLGVGATTRSGWEAFAREGRRSVLEIAANMDMQEDGKYIGSTQAFSPYNPVTRVVARLNQLLSYSLNTSDAVIQGMTADTARNAALRVGEESGMTEETADRIAKQNADYATFKNDTSVTKFLEGVQNALDLIGFGGEIVTFDGTNVIRGRKGGMGLGTLLAKFVKVPANIKSKGVEFGPAGVGIGIYNAVEAAKMARNSAPGSQARQDSMVLQNKASGQIGRGVTGTAFVFAVAMLLKEAKKNGKEWFRDWDQEKDANIKAQNKAEGKSGQQINLSAIGLTEGSGNWDTSDETMDVSSNEPMNQLLTMASALADDDDFISINDYLDAMYTGITENIADMPCVETFSTFQDTMQYSKVYDTTYEEDEEGNLVETREENRGKTIANAAGASFGSAIGGFVPAPVRHVAQMQDEYKRDTKGDNATETAFNQIINNIPTVKIGDRTIIQGRQSLPIKTDAFGNPISQGDVGTRAANTFLANKYSTINQTDESKEINRLYEETGKSLMQSASGPKTVSFGSGNKKRTVELSGDEGRSYAQGRNKAFEQNVGEMMGNPVYQNVDTDMQLPLMTEVENYVKTDAKSKLAQQKGIEYKDQYEGVRALDDPIGYIGVNKGFNLANSAEKYDVVDMLIPEIQGMSKADRDYLREKNSSAMSYYDFLTPNRYGEKASSAEVVHDYKVVASENADKRGVKSPSGADRFKAIYDGYYDGKYNDEDVAAFMTKQQSDGDFDVSKGRIAVFLAALASGKNTAQALQLAKSADIDNDGTINEKTTYIKGKKEATKTLKKGDLDKNGWDVFNEIMYPNKRR